MPGFSNATLAVSTFADEFAPVVTQTASNVAQELGNLQGHMPDTTTIFNATKDFMPDSSSVLDAVSEYLLPVTLAVASVVTIGLLAKACMGKKKNLEKQHARHEGDSDFFVGMKRSFDEIEEPLGAERDYSYPSDSEPDSEPDSSLDFDNVTGNSPEGEEELVYSSEEDSGSKCSRSPSPARP